MNGTNAGPFHDLPIGVSRRDDNVGSTRFEFETLHAFPDGEATELGQYLTKLLADQGPLRFEFRKSM